MNIFLVVLSLFSLIGCSTTSSQPDPQPMPISVTATQKNPCTPHESTQAIDCKNISSDDKAKLEACYEQSIKDSPCQHEELTESLQRLREAREKAEKLLKPNTDIKPNGSPMFGY